MASLRLGFLPATRLKRWRVTPSGGTASGSNDPWRLCVSAERRGRRTSAGYHEEQAIAEFLDEILLEAFMKLRGITACQLAADIDVSPSRIVEPVNGRCPITADTALRLVIHFGMDARFRMTLLTECDMRVASRELKDKIVPPIRVHEHRSA